MFFLASSRCETKRVERRSGIQNINAKLRKSDRLVTVAPNICVTSKLRICAERTNTTEHWKLLVAGGNVHEYTLKLCIAHKICLDLSGRLDLANIANVNT